LGFVRPTILLPADIANQPDPGEAREVLRHELAHVRRYDDWTNLVQHLVRAIFFFHPVVWWIGERLSLEREIACDDYVLHQGGERRNYALILTSLASRLRPGTPMLAPGVSNNNSQLQQRISMILNTRRNSSPGLAKGPLATILTATGLVVTLGLCSGPRLVLAGPPPAAATGVAPSAEPDLVPASPAVPASGPVPAPPAIDSPVVASRAPSLVALGVDPGPKFKPEIPGPAPDEVSVPEAPEPPEPPTTPSMEYAPRIMKLPKVARMEKAGKTPKVSDSSDSDKNADGSIEDRLRRLEKMVRELMEQQEQKHSPGTIYFKDRGGDQAMAERQAARAAEQAQRAAEQAQRAAEQAKRIRELDAMREQDQQYKADLRESFDRHAVHLEALRKAREALGQELERLNRQIEKIEKEQQRSESELPRPRGDAGGSKLPASPAPTERARP
jgi:hypothetical protein